MKKRSIQIASIVMSAALVLLSGVGAYAAAGAASSTYIGKDKAKEIALQHAGVKSTDAYFEKTEMEWDNGVALYEVDFRTSTTDYDYEVNAVSGKVISYKQEKEARSTLTGDLATASGYITQDKAVEIALAHAGVKAADAYVEKAELEWEKGIVYYEVDFRKGNYDYDYEIGAKSGKVISFQKEQEDDWTGVIPDTKPGVSSSSAASSSSSAATSGKITADRAVEIALAHAGLAKANIYDLDVEYERGYTDGYYEVSFDSNRMEYDYKISASTGKILHYEKDYD